MALKMGTTRQFGVTDIASVYLSQRPSVRLLIISVVGDPDINCLFLRAYYVTEVSVVIGKDFTY